MSLIYIIDGYNITSHNKFIPPDKKTRDPRQALLELIKTKKLCGSPNNKIVVVFDGYPDSSADKVDEYGIDIVFSRKETADTKIKRMVETHGNARNIAVVSDDKEIKFFIRALGARPVGVEEFICPQDKPQARHKDIFKPELSYTETEKINRELKKIWLKD